MPIEEDANYYKTLYEASQQEVVKLTNKCNKLKSQVNTEKESANTAWRMVSQYQDNFQTAVEEFAEKLGIELHESWRCPNWA